MKKQQEVEIKKKIAIGSKKTKIIKKKIRSEVNKKKIKL